MSLTGPLIPPQVGRSVVKMTYRVVQCIVCGHEPDGSLRVAWQTVSRDYGQQQPAEHARARLQERKPLADLRIARRTRTLEIVA